MSSISKKTAQSMELINHGIVVQNHIKKLDPIERLTLQDWINIWSREGHNQFNFFEFSLEKLYHSRA